MGCPEARKSNEFKGVWSFLASERGPVWGSFLDPRIPELFQDFEEPLKAKCTLANPGILDFQSRSKELKN